MSTLQVGQIVQYESRIWRVGLVNPSRARLDPVSGTTHELLTAKFTSYGASVNISPTSPLDVLEDKFLTPEQHRRAENLAHRTEESLIIQQPEGFVNTGEESAMAEAVGQPVTPAKSKAKVPPAAAVAQPTVSAQKQANKERLANLKAKATQKQEEKAAKPPKEKTVRPCGCGCGEQVSAYFAQGHDARFKGWMVKVERGTMAVKDLPPMVQKSYQFKKVGEGYVTTKNYKGEPHSGYDKAVAG